jgi:flagellar basal-body rod protein FlgG
MENPENVSVIQGSLEGSGLSVVTEMVYMIETMRLYETNQKALLTQDEMMQKASTQVGRTQ